MNISTKNDLMIRTLSIDPGTLNLGASFSMMDFKNKQFTVEYSNTFSIDRLVQVNNQWILENYSKNIAMYNAVYNLTSNLCYQFNPDWVLCESPYMNSRFPLPYALLTICTQAIQTAVKDYSISTGFSYVDPASVKKGVGVKGNSGDKNAMTDAVLNHPLIKSTTDLTILDEHSIDSIAIGFYGFNEMLQER